MTEDKEIDFVIPNLYLRGYFNITNLLCPIYSCHKGGRYIRKMYENGKITNEDVVNLHVDYILGMSDTELLEKYRIKNTEMLYYILNKYIMSPYEFHIEPGHIPDYWILDKDDLERLCE